MTDAAGTYLTFSRGSLDIAAAPPEWFGRAIARAGDDWEALLRDEKLGEHGDTINIYRAPNGYYVEIHDVFELVARVFIDRPVDYLHFRRDWVLPLMRLSRIADEAAEKQDAH